MVCTFPGAGCIFAHAGKVGNEVPGSAPSCLRLSKQSNISLIIVIKGRRGLSGYFLLLRGVVKVGAYGWYLDVRMKNKIRHSMSIGMRNGSICWNMGKTQKDGPGKVGVLRFCISVFILLRV